MGRVFWAEGRAGAKGLRQEGQRGDQHGWSRRGVSAVDARSWGEDVLDQQLRFIFLSVMGRC